MSAESPRKSSHHGGHTVAPQPVSDRSIIESVAGFINEVVPQGYSSLPLGENKELITWARFEYCDINDPALYPDTSDDRNGTAPLLLVLGYGSGVQVWAIPASGDAIEVLSWRQGVVRTLRILPTPLTNSATPDLFAAKRPLVALCDSSTPGPQFCSISFISLRGGDQVKSIKFKNPVSDVLANRRSVVVSFPERIAVFDASTLEDRLTITTCFPCPGPNPNPVALGSRWLAYAERKFIPSKRCSGGTEGEGIQSYTATVLHAAKSLGKGLRELGETVASSLTGGGPQQPGTRVVAPVPGQTDMEILHPGVVTIIDAQGSWKENGRTEDNVIAHFTAHGEAVVALQFDPTGVLLVTADKRGHDFHLFRIQPHPGGSPLSAVHHLYTLHRGDTTAKVQDIAFASDSRWVAVSTLRGTTHVFPVTPYGGPVGLRTHSTPHVVNRLSRFHRSAGLMADGRNSPQPSDTQASTSPAMPYSNPRLPPYPHPTVVTPLAQIRQPTMQAVQPPSSPNPANAYHRNPSVRALGRNHSSTEDCGGIPLRVSACFAPSRAWLVGSPTVPRDNSNRAHKKSVDSLFVMACHGSLIEYDLETKHATGIPKEKVCDDTAIELEVHAKAQWLLLRPLQSVEVQPPLPPTNVLMMQPLGQRGSQHQTNVVANTNSSDERWLSHVEIVTHSGPHRRLWMGPQFTFKTYTNNAGVTSTSMDTEGIEISSSSRPARSNPVNMPLSNSARPIVPFLIESGSGGSYEQSPRLLDYSGSAGDSDSSPGLGETQLREELADAMMESPGVPPRDSGRRVIVELRRGKQSQTIPIEKIVNPVGTVLTVITHEGSTDGKTIDGEMTDATIRWPTDVYRVNAKSDDPPTKEDNQTMKTYIGLKGTKSKADEVSKEVVTKDLFENLKPRKHQATADKVTDKNIDKVSNNLELNQKRRKTSVEVQDPGIGTKNVNITKTSVDKREARSTSRSVEKDTLALIPGKSSPDKASDPSPMDSVEGIFSSPKSVETPSKMCEEIEKLGEISLSRAKKCRVRPLGPKVIDKSEQARAKKASILYPADEAEKSVLDELKNVAELEESPPLVQVEDICALAEKPGIKPRTTRSTSRAKVTDSCVETASVKNVSAFADKTEKEDFTPVDLEENKMVAWEALSALTTKLQETGINPPRSGKKFKKSTVIPVKPDGNPCEDINEISVSGICPGIKTESIDFSLRARKYQGLDLADIKDATYDVDFKSIPTELETKPEEHFTMPGSLDENLLNVECIEEGSPPEGMIEYDTLYQSVYKCSEETQETPASSSSVSESEGVTNLAEDIVPPKLWSAVASGKTIMKQLDVSLSAVKPELNAVDCETDLSPTPGSAGLGDDDNTNGNSETPTLLQAIKKNKKKNKKRR